MLQDKRTCHPRPDIRDLRGGQSKANLLDTENEGKHREGKPRANPNPTFPAGNCRERRGAGLGRGAAGCPAKPSQGWGEGRPGAQLSPLRAGERGGRPHPRVPPGPARGWRGCHHLPAAPGSTKPSPRRPQSRGGGSGSSRPRGDTGICPLSCRPPPLTPLPSPQARGGRGPAAVARRPLPPRAAARPPLPWRRAKLGPGCGAAGAEGADGRRRRAGGSALPGHAQQRREATRPGRAQQVGRCGRGGADRSPLGSRSRRTAALRRAEGAVLLRGERPAARAPAPAPASVPHLAGGGSATKANGCAPGRAAGLAVASLPLPGSCPSPGRHTEGNRAQLFMYLFGSPSRGPSGTTASSAPSPGSGMGDTRFPKPSQHLSRLPPARCWGTRMPPTPCICSPLARPSLAALCHGSRWRRRAG